MNVQDCLDSKPKANHYMKVMAVFLVLVLTLFPLSSVYAGGSYITNSDNENNARTGMPDNDMDQYICEGDAVMPIEFNIYVDELPTTEAILSIYAYDVDEEAGEIDNVYLNGTHVGRLSGNDGTWNTTVFNIPISNILLGNNLVEITVSSGWCTNIDWGQLLIDGGAADMASISDLTISDYGADAHVTAAVTVEAAETGTYRLEVTLLDASNNNLATSNETFSLSAGNSSIRSALLNYNVNSATGTYRIIANLFDTGTGLQQDSRFITFLHTSGQGPTFDSPPSAFSAQTPPSTAIYGAPYGGYSFVANGTPAPTYALSPSSNPLPPGLNLASNGQLTGTPTAAGTYGGIIVRASNSLGSFDSNAFTITVSPANTTTGVTRSVANPVYGQPLYLTATVSPVAPSTFSPTGLVQFFVDGVAFGAPVALSGGSATSATTTTLSAGSHSYYAVYTGSTNNAGSNSLPAAMVNVNQNATTTVVVSSSPTIIYGQPVYLTATVDESLPSVVTPVGQVQFYLDGELLGSPVGLNGSGQAVSADLHTLVPGGHLRVGSYTFSANYLGNSNTLASGTGESTQTVNPAPTTLVITSSENPTVYGTSLDMTITVTQNAPSIVTPGGQVQLSIDGVLFGAPLTLDGSGQAVRRVPYLNLWPGDHTITAVYTPSSPAQFVGSNNHSAPLNQRVNKANPVFDIRSDVEFPVASQPVGYSVVVGPSMVTQGIPSGMVQFFVDGVPLGGPVTLDAAGRANSPLTIELPAGSHEVTVSYTGDDYFLDVPVSPAMDHLVSKAQTTVSIVSIDPASSVVGQPVLVTVQVSAVAPASDAPDGTVIVSNGIDSCVATLDATGAGSCLLEPTSPGSPDLIAIYPETANFAGNASAPFPGPVVSKADSAVGITSFFYDGSVLVTGQPLTIFFAVSPVTPGWGTPTGLVTISDGQGRTCSASVAAGSCQITFDQAGPINLSASYEGDGNFNPSNAVASSGPEVAKAGTSVELLSSSATSVYGQPVHFTATIAVTAPGAGSPTGFVQFTIDGIAFGEPVAVGGGSAVSPDLSTLPVGTHSISAMYLGDMNFASSAAPALDQVVNKAFTSLVVTSSQNPSPYGLSVLVTATVIGVDPSTAIPTSGTVQFIVDGVPYGAPVELTPGGTASKLLPYTALWVGTHNITAVYSGNSNFFGIDNIANPYLQVVERGILTITITPTIEQPVYGQAVGFTTTVFGIGANNPLPTGTVQFAVDGINLGVPVALDAAASAASDLISNLSVGPHRVSVTYSGDDYYQPTMVEAPAGVLISKADVTATITGFDPATVVVGQPVVVSFNVLAASPGAGVPDGTVTISNGIDSCTAPVSAGSCSLTPTAVGSPQLTISYSGDSNFNPFNAGNPIDGPAVDLGSVSLSFSHVAAGPVVVGQPYAVTVQVTPVLPGTLIPVGAIVTISNGTDFCTAIVQPDGSATCNITPTAAGSQELVAMLEGGANYHDAVSTPVSGPAVNAASTTTMVVSSLNPVVEGAGVHFEATVMVSTPGSGLPTGVVQFMVGGLNLGAPVSLVNGMATSPVIYDLALGTHAITATYLGDGNFVTSTSAALSQKVVTGDLSALITPGEGSELIYHGSHLGQPVTTIIEIPAGAVAGEVTLVFHQFYNSMLTPPDGQDFVINFTIDAYVDGVLQPSLTFLQPLVITMEYNPVYWNEEKMDVVAWDGSQWDGNGLDVIQRDTDAHAITFTLAGTGAAEFSLICEHQYIYWFPIVGK